MKIFQRPSFHFDVAEALHYFNKRAGAEIAERFYDAVLATIQELEKQPFIGRPRKDLKPPGLRSWRVAGFSRWIIIYVVDSDLILLRLREGSMDLPSLRERS